MAKLPKRVTEKRKKRIAETLKLRSLGLTYTEIAGKLAISETQAREDAQIGMSYAIQEPANEVKIRELERLDKLTLIHTKAILSTYATHKEICDSTDRLLRIMERRAKYLGLDNPTPAPDTSTGDVLTRLLEESARPYQKEE